jgi:hypothetical protein
LENNSVSSPIIFLSYIFQRLAMKTSALLLVVGVAAVLAVALAPSSGSASAEKSVECTNGGGQQKDCGSPPAKNTKGTNPNDKEVNCGNRD